MARGFCVKYTHHNTVCMKIMATSVATTGTSVFVRPLFVSAVPVTSVKEYMVKHTKAISMTASILTSIPSI